MLIAVIGSLNMDIVVRTPRFPLPGETLAGQDMNMIPGGKGANQAVAAARLGADVVMVGRVGDDSLGPQLVAALQAERVNTEFVAQSAEVSTGVAIINVEQSGENNIIIVAGANGQLAPADVDCAADLLKSADVLILQLEIPLETVSYAALVAKQKDVPVILNAAPAQVLPADLLASLDHLIVNESEAALLANVSPDDSLGAAQILRDAGAQTVVITLGDKGALLLNAEGAITVPGFSVNAVDTTAAGDSFVAAYAVAVVEKKSPADALRFANAAGARATTKFGAQPSLPTRVDVDALCLTASS